MNTSSAIEGKAAQAAAPTPGGDWDGVAFDTLELEAVFGTHVGTAEPDLMAFRVTSKADENVGAGRSFAASIPDRQIVWIGSTRERAIAAMLCGVARLARDGSIDPSDPRRPGTPTIQHVLGILSERLAWHVERRREGCEGAAHSVTKRQPTNVEPIPAGDGETAEWQARTNEVIAALGTAISALARIKDL